MKKFNLKEGLTRGIGFAVIYILIKLWAAEDHSTKTITSIVVGGIVGGLIFGLIMGIFTRSKSIDNNKN